MQRIDANSLEVLLLFALTCNGLVFTPWLKLLCIFPRAFQASFLKISAFNFFLGCVTLELAFYLC